MRSFLYAIAILTVLVLGLLFALRLYSDELTEVAFVPDGDFTAQDALASNAYDDPELWFSRPGMGAANDPARWQPAVRVPDPEDEDSLFIDRAAAEPAPTAPVGASDENLPVAVFFVHPTSFYERGAWNAPLDHADSRGRARLMVHGMASAFNRADEIWVPRYRQATFGAYLTDAPAAGQAIDAAYADVAQAFDYFLSSIDPATPIVLAGHSQGGQHVTRLLQQHGAELRERLVAVYAIGWPISITRDLPALPVPACATPAQAGCLISYVSFAEPADPGQLLRRYQATPGLDGSPRGDSPILCTNPLTGMIGGAAEAAQNLGTLVPNEDLTDGDLVPGAVPARCADNGLLLIGDPPELGEYVLPGNNYHVYDIPLFWRNLQEDVARRYAGWAQAQTQAQTQARPAS